MNAQSPGDNVYSKEQLEKITEEFSRTQGMCYLDHAGATLYSEKQLQSIYQEFSKNIYGNPHTRSLPSQTTIDCIDIIRYQILSHFNTSPDQYSVIFTSGTTKALKIIAETFDFKGGGLWYLEDNHTSVLGMRSYAPSYKEIKITEAFRLFFNNKNNDNDSDKQPKHQTSPTANNLFVYPAQSNFSGTKYPLAWIEKVQNGILNPSETQNSYVALDAATMVSTNNLDLTKYQPDFVTISFYKIFGYPTGLGALLVKKCSENVLLKKYFGGGTVLMALSSENVMVSRTGISERFEDGTNSYLSIISLKHGFDTLKRLDLTFDLISKHTFALAKHTYHRLAELHHSNGNPLVLFYNDTNFERIQNQGGIVTFNLKRANGDFVGFVEVMHLANLHNVHLRTGCFCNPGACQRFLNLSPDDVRKQFEAGHTCGDEKDLINGYPTGAIRISFGYMSTYKCADLFINVVENCFVTKPTIRKERVVENSKNNYFQLNNKTENKTNNPVISNKKINCHYTGHDTKIDQRNNGHVKVTGKLTKVLLYPIKSCKPYCPENCWNITSTGLEYDRKWMIVKPSGSCVSQKEIRELCLIEPVIDVKRNRLKISYKGNFDIVEVPLDPLKETPFSKNINGYLCESKVCGDKIQGWDCGDQVADWLSDKLGKSGLRLLRQCDFNESVGRSSKNGPDSQLSLANKGQFLLVNVASIRWLKERIPEIDTTSSTIKATSDSDTDQEVDSILLRFRPNLAVDFDEPFVENNLESFKIGGATFQFSGTCTRCQMICIDQETGDISKEPLQTLSREMQGKIRFGVYLSHKKLAEGKCIEIGTGVEAIKRYEN